MASTPIEIPKLPAGLTLTCDVYPHGSDTADQTSITLTEATNRKGTYSGTVTAASAGVITVKVKSGSTVIAEVTSTILDTTATFILDELNLADLVRISGDAQSATDLKDFADDGYDPSTNKVQGVVLVDTLTTLTNLPAITSNWLTATGLATDAVEEIRNAITGGAYDLDTDANGRIRVVDGTGTGEISLTSGLLDWNSAWDTEVQSEVNDALVALNLDHLLAVATGAADMTTEVVDNSILSRILSNGDTSVFDPSTDGLQAIRDRGDAAWGTATGFSTHSASDVWAVATRVLTAATNIYGPIADQVWEEAIADHSGTAGSTAAALNAAGSAGDPWTTALPGAYGAGSAGFIIGTNLDAILSARTLASASYATASALATVDTVVDGIQTDLSNATDGLGALKALIDTLPSRSSITGGNYALDTDANGRVRIVDGTGTGELDTLSGTVLLRSATQASIDAIEADTAELQGDWVNDGRLDLLIDAIKTKTDQMTYSVANKIDSNPTPTSAICNRIADHVRRRTQANVEASSDGDTLDLSSLYGFIQQAQESSISGTTLTVTKTDGTTALGTKTLTSNASAEPVTGIA